MMKQPYQFYYYISHTVLKFRAVWLFFLMLFIHNSSFSKNDSLYKWTVGIHAFLDYDFYRGVDIDKVQEKKRNAYINKEEKYLIGNTEGINIGYSFNKNFKLMSGLFFTERGYRIKRREFNNHTGNTGHITYFDNTTAIDAGYYYKYVYVPVICLYSIPIRKYSTAFFFNLGASIDYLLSSISISHSYQSDGSVYLGYYDLKSIKYYKYRNYIYNGIGGMGINYYLNNNMILSAEIQGRYSTGIYLYDKWNERLYSIGLGINLQKRF